MKRLRDLEGYLLMDNSNSPGIPDEVMVAQGLPVGAGRTFFECPTFTCKHCQTVVIINPKRNRERAYCRGCDHLLCDGCGAERARTGLCRTFDQVIDEILTACEKAESIESIIIP